MRATDTDSTLVRDAAADATDDAINIGVWTSEDGAKVTYEADYFQDYQAVNAADMVRWVPGGAALLPDNNRGRNNQEKRGFGSDGDQILINGKRISGKSNDISSALRRIQSDVVSRIEVIRGTTAGLDVRSEGTLVNIVLAEDISGGSGSWQLHSGFYGEATEYDGLISYSDAVGGMNYLVSAEYGPYNRGSLEEETEELFAPGETEPFERRDRSKPELEEEIVLNTNANWSFNNGNILNLNARIADQEKEEIETSHVTTAGSPDIAVLLNTSIEDGLDWEFGGDFENSLGSNGRLKTRAIYSSQTEEEEERLSLTSTVPGNIPSESLVLNDETTTESIIRSSYSWPVVSGQNLELGLEAAVNTLEKEVQLFEVLPDGSLDPIVINNANSDVEENRYEFFSTHFWQLRDSIALESALNVEYSVIEQTGIDVSNERSFTYVKPRFDLRWDISDQNQLRATLERTVSQLDFGDFVASIDDDSDQVDAGNPDLEPEQAWEYKLTYERRLSNDNGLLSAQLFYNDIEDHIDKVAATDIISAAGNIGAAENYGLDLTASWRLGAIGIEGAVIDVNYIWQDSSTIDPFTGQERVMRFKPQNRANFKFRHDITAWRLNYQFDVGWWGEREQHDITFRDSSETLKPRANFTVQYQLTDALLLWFDTRLLFDNHNRRYRDRFDGNIANNVPLRSEIRDQYRRREYIVGLRGQF